MRPTVGSRRGATLPELLVCMSVMGVLLFLAARLVTHAYEFYRFTDESISLQREGILALQSLSEDLTASHQRSIVTEEIIVASPTPSHHEDKVVIPLPMRMDGMTEVNEEGASKWMSVAGYAIDTTRPTRNLMRYLGDTAQDPGNNFKDSGEYIADIEFVKLTDIPTVDEIAAFVDPGLRARSVCRNVFSFEVRRSVDVVDIKIVILIPGRVRAGLSLDNSISLNTTILPRN